MGKTFSRTRKYFDDDFYDDENHRHNDQLKERRMLKKMKNALRNRNIDDLIHLNEDD